MTNTSDRIEWRLSYALDDWAVTAKEEREIIALLVADPNASQTVLDMQKNGTLRDLFDRVDDDDNLLELVQVLGGSINTPSAILAADKELQARAMRIAMGSKHPHDTQTWKSVSAVQGGLPYMLRLSAELQASLRASAGGKPPGAGFSAKLLAARGEPCRQAGPAVQRPRRDRLGPAQAKYRPGQFDPAAEGGQSDGGAVLQPNPRQPGGLSRLAHRGAAARPGDAAADAADLQRAAACLSRQAAEPRRADGAGGHRASAGAGAHRRLHPCRAARPVGARGCQGLYCGGGRADHGEHLDRARPSGGFHRAQARPVRRPAGAGDAQGAEPPADRRAAGVRRFQHLLRGALPSHRRRPGEGAGGRGLAADGGEVPRPGVRRLCQAI